MSFGTAIYRCYNCEHIFTQKPGPTGDKYNPGCPKCRHLYLNWINFEQWYNSFIEYLKENPELIEERLAHGVV